MVISERLRVLDPTEEAVIDDSGLAPRLDTMDGKVIGLYSNKKLNADELLDHVEAVLRERYEPAGFVRGVYNAGRIMGRDEWRDVERCDAIVLTHGD